MPAVRQNPSSYLPTGQTWPRVASILGALLVATVLLSVLFNHVRAAPRVMETGKSTESAGAANANNLIEQPLQTATVRTICTVGCDFDLIQEAIDDPSVVDGDTLLVMDAVHIENWITVDKDVLIRGQGAQDTIVQATSAPPGGGSPLFSISSGTVATISDMTIRYGLSFGTQTGVSVSIHESEEQDTEAESIAVGLMDFWGAGISVMGDLTLDNAVVSDNYIVITSTMQSIATSTAPITATARATAVAVNQLNARGAGIYNLGNLTVTHSTVADNEIYAAGVVDASAVANAGVITETAVVTSEATIAGAGIYNEGNLWLANSTVSGNRAHTRNMAHAANEVVPILSALAAPAYVSGDEQAVQKMSGTQSAYLLMESDANGQRVETASDEKGQIRPLPGWLGAVALTSNLTQDEIRVTAYVKGHAVAGVYNAGTATIQFSTISDNNAVTEAAASADQTTVITEEIGGLYNETGAELSLNSTLIASQAQGVDCAQTADSSDGYNLDSDGSCALSGTGDQSNVEAMIGPLGDNGGPTPTHPLLFGSAALDAADPICPSDASSTDQRGVSRPFEGDGVGDARCDVGAVEAVFAADLGLEEAVVGQTQIDGQPGNTFTETADKVTAGARVTYTFSVHNDGPDGAPGVLLQHTVPEALEATGTTITATQGSCDSDLPADRSDPLRCELGNVLPGEIVTVTVAAATAPSVSDGAVLQSAASVSSAAIDDRPLNDSVQLITDVNARADVVLTKDQTQAVGHAGQVLTYVVSIQNQGPSDAPPVIVRDILPDGIGSVSWTCAADGGALCDAASGSGSILETIELPAASAVTYTIGAQVKACLTIENSASASDTLDPYPENNGDTAVNRPYCVYLLPLLGSPAATVEN